jgi:hypothetical protein
LARLLGITESADWNFASNRALDSPSIIHVIKPISKLATKTTNEIHLIKANPYSLCTIGDNYALIGDLLFISNLTSLHLNASLTINNRVSTKEQYQRYCSVHVEEHIDENDDIIDVLHSNHLAITNSVTGNAASSGMEENILKNEHWFHRCFPYTPLTRNLSKISSSTI